MSLTKKQLAHISVIERELKALKLCLKDEKESKITKLSKKEEESIIECSTKKELGEFNLEILLAFAKKNKIKIGKKATKTLLLSSVLKYIKENYESDSDSESDSESEIESDSD